MHLKHGWRALVTAQIKNEIANDDNDGWCTERLALGSYRRHKANAGNTWWSGGAKACIAESQTIRTL